MTTRIPAAVLDRTIAALRRPDGNSIGSMERLAGVTAETRADFWRQFRPDSFPNTQAYLDAGMAECRRLIKANTAWVPL